MAHALLTEVETAHDTAMAELTDRQELLLQALDNDRVAAECRGDDLDGDEGAAETVTGLVDRAGRSLADARKEFILGKCGQAHQGPPRPWPV